MHSCQTGEELEIGKGHHGPVHQVSFSPDGEMYASGSEDGKFSLFFSILVLEERKLMIRRESDD